MNHPKTVNHKVNYLFQLVFGSLMGPITPEALFPELSYDHQRIEGKFK